MNRRSPHHDIREVTQQLGMGETLELTLRGDTVLVHYEYMALPSGRRKWLSDSNVSIARPFDNQFLLRTRPACTVYEPKAFIPKS